MSISRIDLHTSTARKLLRAKEVPDADAYHATLEDTVVRITGPGVVAFFPSHCWVERFSRGLRAGYFGSPVPRQVGVDG